MGVDELIGEADQAALFAQRALEGVTDKHGEPLIEHARRVAERAPLEGKAAAWLHDVVEDTPVTLDDLRAHGFSRKTVDAVALLTRPDEPGFIYDEWIDYVANFPGRGGPLARRVKLCDLADNLSRPLPEGSEQLRERYLRAQETLRQARSYWREDRTRDQRRAARRRIVWRTIVGVLAIIGVVTLVGLALGVRIQKTELPDRVPEVECVSGITC